MTNTHASGTKSGLVPLSYKVRDVGDGNVTVMPAVSLR